MKEVILDRKSNNEIKDITSGANFHVSIHYLVLILKTTHLQTEMSLGDEFLSNSNILSSIG